MLRSATTDKTAVVILAVEVVRMVCLFLCRLTFELERLQRRVSPHARLRAHCSYWTDDATYVDPLMAGNEAGEVRCIRSVARKG